MTLPSLILSALGLVMVVVGAALNYINGPRNDIVFSEGDAFTDYAAEERLAARRNFLMGLGALLVVLGAVVQFVATCVAANLW